MLVNYLFPHMDRLSCRATTASDAVGSLQELRKSSHAIGNTTVLAKE